MIINLTIEYNYFIYAFLIHIQLLIYLKFIFNLQFFSAQALELQKNSFNSGLLVQYENLLLLFFFITNLCCINNIIPCGLRKNEIYLEHCHPKPKNS